MSKMASKRQLYKAAPQENTGIRGKRKTLAQGRLVTKPIGSQGSSSHLVQGTAITDTYNAGRTNITRLHGTQAQDTGASQHALTEQREQAELHLSRVVEDPVLTPRRGTPSAQKESPRPMRPSHSLDLSDTDSEIVFNHKLQSPGHIARMIRSDVLVVDAGKQTKSADDSEVNISIGYRDSPAKVVCHSPGMVKSNLRHTGQVEQAQRIQVDQIPRVSILEDLDLTESGAPKPVATFKSPMVVRESSIAGGCPDQNSTARPVLVDQELSRPIEEMSFRKTPEVSFPKMKLDSSVESLGEFAATVNVVREHAECTKKATLDEKSKTDTSALLKEKKTKKGRVMQSKYMQEAKAKSKTTGPMKATDRTVLSKMKIGSKPTKQKSQKEKLLTVNKQPGSAKKTHKSQLSSTPVTQISTGGGKTSTPTMDGSLFHAPDTSAIAPGPNAKPRFYGTPNKTGGSVHEHSRVQGQHIDRSRENPFDLEMSGLSIHDSTMGTKQKVETGDGMTQLELDLLYARYLQWIYLESKAKKAFQEQEKDVMSQLYGLWEENDKMTRRKADLEVQLAKVKHANALDEALEIQHSGLGPVASHLKKLRQDYSTLSQALDTTRHQIPVKGICIPDDEEKFQDSLESALLESEQLLGELSVMLRPHQGHLSSFAEALEVLDNSVGHQIEELNRCKELVAAAETLTTQESSLNIQALQSC